MEVVKVQLEPRSQHAGDGPRPNLDLKLESCRMFVNNGRWHNQQRGLIHSPEFGDEAAPVGGAGVNRNRGIRITRGHPLLASALRELKETFARTKGRY